MALSEPDQVVTFGQCHRYHAEGIRNNIGSIKTTLQNIDLAGLQSILPFQSVNPMSQEYAIISETRKIITVRKPGRRNMMSILISMASKDFRAKARSPWLTSYTGLQPGVSN